MKYSKHLLSIAVIVFIAALTLFADDQQNRSTFNDNKLVYKVKYVDGYDLAKLLDEYIDKSQGMKVDYVQGLDTVIITAPKESHSILMKLIEEFDKKPIKVDLIIYIGARSPIKIEDLKTSKTYDDVKKAFVTDSSAYYEAKYERYGQFTIPLTSGKKIESPTIWTFSFEKDSITYKLLISIFRISMTNSIITLRAFNVQLVTEDKNYEQLINHSFDIDVASNKLTIIDSAYKILGKNSPETLQIGLLPKIIKD